MPGGGPRTALRRRLALAAVVAAVVLAHAVVTRAIMQGMAGMAADTPAIERMEAEMLADMTLAAPPVVSAPPPSAEPAAVVAEAPDAAPPASAASAASAPEEAASEIAAASASQASDEAAKNDAASEAASAPDTAVASAAQADPDAPPFEWPLATRVTFQVEGHIRGPIYGNAAVQWVRQGMRYQVHVDAAVGPSFAPLGSQRWTSEGDITPQGLLPRRFEAVNKLLIKSAQPRVVTFGEAQVHLADGKDVERPDGVQDPASHYIQLAYQLILDPRPLQAGGTLAMPLAFPRRVTNVVYDILGSETLETPLGRIEAFHLRPRPPADRKPDAKAGELLADLWIAPSLQYLPVRMLLRQGENFLDMKMDRAPQQTAAGAGGDGTAASRPLPPAQRTDPPGQEPPRQPPAQQEAPLPIPP